MSMARLGVCQLKRRGLCVITAVELGIIYAIMALGVYLTFRVLEFPDLTVDGSFATGAAISAVMILNGQSPYFAVVCAFAGGLVAGLVTGLLNTKGNIDGLLAGILTQIALYSVNLRIMGTSNIGLLRATTVFTPLREQGLLGTWGGPLMMMPFVLVILGALVWFLHTNLGLALRGSGDAQDMVRSFGVSTDFQKILGLSLSNGMVAVSGSLIAQYQGFADVGMGIGIIVAGLASVIIGQAILGRLTILRAATAVVVGAVLYRVIIQLALIAGFNPNDMKLISAVIVVLALLIPQWRIPARLRWVLGFKRRTEEQRMTDRLVLENAALEDDK